MVGVVSLQKACLLLPSSWLHTSGSRTSKTEGVCRGFMEVRLARRPRMQLSSIGSAKDERTSSDRAGDDVKRHSQSQACVRREVSREKHDQPDSVWL